LDIEPFPSQLHLQREASSPQSNKHTIARPQRV